MATWKKVIVSGSNISQLNNDSAYLSATGQGIVSSSAQTIANLPAGTVSGSSQITITESQISDLDHFTIADLPAGTVSSSAQITITESQISDLDHFTIADLPAGTVSSSAQIGQASAIAQGIIELATSAEVNAGTDGTRAVVPSTLGLWPGSSNITTLGTVTAGDVSAILPSGTISGSSQITITESQISDLDHFTVADLPAGTVSSSAQITITESQISDLDHFTVADLPSGTVSSSAQITITESQISDLDHFTVADLPSGTVSGSAQIDLSAIPTTATAIYYGNTGGAGLVEDSTNLRYNAGADILYAPNLVLSGDLTVQGTTTTIDTTNLSVEDRFIFLNEGSGSVAPTGEGGIIVEGTTAGEGDALFHDSTGRWAVASGISKTATAATPDGFLSVVLTGNANSDATIDALVANEYEAKGNMFIGNDEGIWIYS